MKCEYQFCPRSNAIGRSRGKLRQVCAAWLLKHDHIKEENIKIDNRFHVVIFDRFRSR